MSKNIGKVYVFTPQITDHNGKIMKGHPFLYFEMYTTSGNVKSFLLCQSNDNDEVTKYRYTIKLDHENMGRDFLIGAATN